MLPYISRYFKMQVSSTVAHALVTPQRYDILCGRGRGWVFQHPGNVLFRAVVEKKARHYASASTKAQKSSIIRAIASEVLSTGARVLTKYVPCLSLWCHVLGAKGDKMLRNKINYHLRVCLMAVPSLSPYEAHTSNESDEAKMLHEHSKC